MKTKIDGRNQMKKGENKRNHLPYDHDHGIKWEAVLTLQYRLLTTVVDVIHNSCSPSHLLGRTCQYLSWELERFYPENSKKMIMHTAHSTNSEQGKMKQLSC